MKKIELNKLLQKHSIVHPTTIKSAKLSPNGGLEVEIEGFPWWQEELGDELHGKMKLTFSEVTTGYLDLNALVDEDNEALEEFQIKESEELPWTQDYGFAIYCSEPVDNPFSIYEIAHDWLQSNGSLFEVNDFLNFGHSGLIRDFTRICQSSSFLLARAPSELANLICEELTRCDITHNKFSEHLRDLPKFVVTMSGSQFFCSGAYCIYD